MDDFLTEVQCEEIYANDETMSLEEIFQDFEEPD